MLSHREFRTLVHVVIWLTMCIGCVVVLWFGEAGSYWLALRHVRTHRQAKEPLVIDASGHWMWPRVEGMVVLRQRRAFPPSLWQVRRPVWLLEHRGTGLRRSLPPGATCGNKVSFGGRAHFHVRKCWLTSGREVLLSNLSVKWELRWKGRTCRKVSHIWHCGRMRLSLKPQHSFYAGKRGRSCLMMRPPAGGWLSLSFPSVSVDGGAHFAAGFHDQAKSKSPVSFWLRVMPSKGSRRGGDTLKRVTLHPDKTWHDWFLQPVRGHKGRSRVSLWIRAERPKAAPICFSLKAFSQQKKKAVVRRPLPLLRLVPRGVPLLRVRGTK